MERSEKLLGMEWLRADGLRPITPNKESSLAAPSLCLGFGAPLGAVGLLSSSPRSSRKKKWPTARHATTKTINLFIPSQIE